MWGATVMAGWNDGERPGSGRPLLAAWGGERTLRAGRILAKRRALRVMGCDAATEREFGAAGARQLRREQLASAFSLTRAMMVGNLAFAPMLTINLLGHGALLDAVAIGWCAVLCLVSIAFLGRAFARERAASIPNVDRVSSVGRVPSVDRTPAALRALFLSSAALASLWCVPVIVFYGLSGGVERGVVAAIMAGIMSAGAASLSRAQCAARAWLLISGGIHTLVALQAGAQSGAMGDFTLAAFAVIATIGLWLGVDERAQSAMAAFRQARTLEEKNGIIDLLLKEYEGAGTEWVWEVDAAGYVVRAPQQVLDMLGLDRASMGGVPLPEHVKRFCLDEGADARADLMNALAERRAFADTILPIRDARDGTRRWIMTRGHPIETDGDFSGWRGICADATQQVEKEAEVRFLASHDALTGLENRVTHHARLAEWQRTGRTFTCLAIDLDRFKLVNDTMGHAAGDELLRQVARRIAQAATFAGACAKGSLSIARIGGDEFALAVAGEGQVAGATRSSTPMRSCTPIEVLAGGIAERIVDLLAKPFTLEGEHARIGASVGYVVAPTDGRDLATLATRADLALYRAKSGGRGQSCRYDPALDDEPGDARALEADLRVAIERGEMTLAYQPIVAVDGEGQGRLAGREALLRWTHPARGPIGPDRFIPVAEETGLIVSIGEWVLRRACEAASEWNEGVPVAVNVSARQLQDPGFTTRVLAALAHGGLAPERLEIEITESALVSDTEGVVRVIAQLRGLGVRVSLDDFGTGYSSLAYLAGFDLDRIKIDRSFVAGSDGSRRHARAIVRAVAGLAADMGLEAVGEGVETAEQALMLREAGCHLQQGWLHGRPVVPSEVPNAEPRAPLAEPPHGRGETRLRARRSDTTGTSRQSAA